MPDFIDWFGTLLIVSAIVALFAGGISFWKTKLGGASDLVSSSTHSAIQASGILAAVPIAALVVEEGWSSEFVIVLVALVVGAIFMAAVVGFPVALYVARKVARNTAGEIEK